MGLPVWIFPDFLEANKQKSEEKHGHVPVEHPYQLHYDAPIPTTIVTTNLQPGSIEEIPQPALEARHIGALLGPGGVHHREGGCKDSASEAYLNSMTRILPGPSKLKTKLLANVTPQSA